MTRIICGTCGGAREGQVGSACDRMLAVPGVGTKPCGGEMLAWDSGFIPGLGREVGAYDAQVDAIYSTLNAPELVMLVVFGGPKGNGFSIAGQAGLVPHISHILRKITDDIDGQLGTRFTKTNSGRKQS